MVSGRKVGKLDTPETYSGADARGMSHPAHCCKANCIMVLGSEFKALGLGSKL